MLVYPPPHGGRTTRTTLAFLTHPSPIRNYLLAVKPCLGESCVDDVAVVLAHATPTSVRSVRFNQ